VKTKQIFQRWLDVITQTIDPREFDECFYQFVENCVEYLNLNQRRRITALPFHCENILWELSLQDNPFRHRFAFLLCRLFVSNDGEILNDHLMISRFLDQWRDYRNATLEFSVEVLGLFIDAIEGQLDRNLIRTLCLHRFDLLPNVDVKVCFVRSGVTVMNKFQKYITIGSVIARLVKQRNLNINSIELFHQDTVIPRSDSISKYIKDGEICVTFEAQYVNNRKKLYHIRTEFPSRLILSSPWIEPIFNQIRSINGWIIHEFLKKLPLLDCAPPIIQSFESGRQILTSEYFPYDHPCLFSYNFITLIQYVEFVPKTSISRCWMSDAIDFLLQQMKFLPRGEITTIEIIHEFVHFLGLEHNYMIEFTSETRFGLFSFLVGFLQPEIDRDFSIEIQNVILQSFSGCVGRFPYHGEHQDLIEFLLFHPVPEIRVFGLSALNTFIIPMHILINLIISHDDLPPEFITAIADHFHDSYSIEDIGKLSTRLVCMFQTANPATLLPSLSVCQKMLQSNHVPEEVMPAFLGCLIQIFLEPSRNRPDSSTFEIAAECLADLSDTEFEGQLMLCDFLSRQHLDRYPMPEFLKYPIVGEECCIGPFGRVGLINSPSHVNAVLQQIFAIGPLRNAVMYYQDENPFIIELSRLFFFLRYSQSKVISGHRLMVNASPSQHPDQFLIQLLDVIPKFCFPIVADFPVEHPPSDGILFVRINEMDMIPELFCGTLNLTGIIIHNHHGQYSSIVQTERGWLLFNDDEITSVDITKRLNPILLVYTSLPDEDSAPPLSGDFESEITKGNENIGLLQVLCSRGYHHLMERIAERGDQKYLSVCLHYAVDTLPFSYTGAESGKFFDAILMKICGSDSTIAEDYLTYLIQSFFIPCIVTTARQPVRRGHAALIERALATKPQIDPILFVKELMPFITPSSPSHSQIDELFRVLLAFL
jgi:hypothetical protein